MSNVIDVIFLIIGLLQIPLGLACLWSFFKNGSGFTGFGTQNHSTFNISSTNTQINHKE